VYKTHKAFTLIELVVVVAIISLLAAILFPVFRSSMVAAKKTMCVNNFHQVNLASSIYIADYDDTFMPVNYQPAESPNSKNDRTWVQMLLPYLTTYKVFRCPGDSGKRTETEASFDQDLIPGDVVSRYYSASMRSNVGYNYLYLSPIYRNAGRWESSPRSATMIEKPSRMLMFVDTVWDRDASGHPQGGGSWLVIPPCRYIQASRTPVDSFNVAGKAVFATYNGWNVTDDYSAARYGSAWPWHGDRITVVRVDGSAGSLTVDELSNGCDVEENWNGLIDAQSNYIWDMK
jgi:prepilin-type N-terminal cleavage/methylation domain-containing protein